MIIDSIENVEPYRNWSNSFRDGFDFLLRKDIASLAEGWQSVGTGDIRAAFSHTPGRKRRDAKLESHRKHIDIQFILGGTDRMGWRPRTTCHTIHKAYDSATDVEFLEEDPELWFKLKPGMFVIFFPEDAHMPQVCSGMIHKVVVKIPVSSDYRRFPLTA